MKKRLLLSLAAVVAISLGIVGMSAYEAHIINVTAHIENALNVDTTPIEFGTVFPQEYFTDKSFTVALSSSFLAEDRVDDVSYVIKQKPKCKAIDPQNSVQYVPVGYATHTCPDGYAVMLSLCPYLSKLPDGTPANDIGVPSYFQGTSCNTADGQTASGKLAKSESDNLDTWTVDLKVPPFEGFVAQDWPAGCPVLPKGDYNPNGTDLGCDLWVEVNGISLGFCGDGIQQAGEGCDDGNIVSGDGCSATCVAEFCGDGITNNVTEECDDGNQIPGDGCENNCTLTPPPSPECSDGLDNDGDTFTDLTDPGCTDSADDNELGITECDDGLDNDGDAYTDFPDDPGCISPSDDDEGGV